MRSALRRQPGSLAFRENERGPRRKARQWRAFASWRPQDAGAGPTVGNTGQTTGTGSTIAGGRPATDRMNRATGDVAASSQDAQKQMQGLPTAAQQARNRRRQWPIKVVDRSTDGHGAHAGGFLIPDQTAAKFLVGRPGSPPNTERAPSDYAIRGGRDQ